uniref:Uncharacterized protein n=1 Tax=Apteryx owenii TaxID=8824 RepID=A0A8B9PJ19_APTOW
MQPPPPAQRETESCYSLFTSSNDSHEVLATRVPELPYHPTKMRGTNSWHSLREGSDSRGNTDKTVATAGL